VQAFRHCFWNALMTRRIGRSQASKVQTVFQLRAELCCLMHTEALRLLLVRAQHAQHWSWLATLRPWAPSNGLNWTWLHLQVATGHENANKGPAAERSMGEGQCNRRWHVGMSLLSHALPDARLERGIQIFLCCCADLYNNLKVVPSFFVGPPLPSSTDIVRLRCSMLMRRPCLMANKKLCSCAQGREIGQASSSDSNADARCKAAALNGTLRRCCGF
jgi:hypothetical protein